MQVLTFWIKSCFCLHHTEDCNVYTHHLYNFRSYVWGIFKKFPNFYIFAGNCEGVRNSNWSCLRVSCDQSVGQAGWPCSSVWELTHCGEDGCETYNCTKEEQRSVICFLWAEGVPGAQIHLRMCAQYGDKVLSRRIVCEWIEMFENGRTSVTDAERSRRPATATATRNEERTLELIRENRRITVEEVAGRLNVSVGSACYSSVFANQFQGSFFIPRGRDCSWTSGALCIRHIRAAIFKHLNPLIDNSTRENFIPILCTHAEMNLCSRHTFCPQKAYDRTLFLFGAIYKFRRHLHHSMTTLILNCKVSWLAWLTSHMTLSDTTNYYSSRPHRFPRKYKSAETFWRSLVLCYSAHCQNTFCNHSCSDLSSVALETDVSPSRQPHGRERHKSPDARSQVTSGAASTLANSDQPNLHPLPVSLTTDMRYL